MCAWHHRLPPFHCSMWRRQIKVSSRASTFKMAVRGSQVLRSSRRQMESVNNRTSKEPNKTHRAVARTQFWCCGPDGLVPTKRSALWREIHFGRSAHILRKKISIVFYRIEPTIRYTLAMFFRKFPRFQGIVGQVHQLYAPRCGKTRIVAWRL